MNVLAQNVSIPHTSTQVIDTVVEEGIRINCGIASTQWTTRFLQESTVVIGIKDFFLLVITCWTNISTATATIIARYTRNLDLPGGSKFGGVCSQRLVGLLELIFPITIIITTQTAQLVLVVSGSSDYDMIDKIVIDLNTKVGVNKDSYSMLIGPNLSVFQV